MLQPRLTSSTSSGTWEVVGGGGEMVAQSSACLVPQVQVLVQTPEEGARTRRATRDTRGLSRWPETKKRLIWAPFLGFVVTVVVCSGLFQEHCFVSQTYWCDV